MPAMMLLMVLAVGSDQDTLPGSPGTPMIVQNSTEFSRVAGPYHYEPPRDRQDNDGLVCGFFKYCGAWFRPMPQTCYSPHFGCYPGNGRDIQRYPAFHGYYYRQAYNYRTLFEYPWQAAMQEPQPLEMNSERSLVGKMPEPVASPPEVIERPSSSRLNP